MKKIRDYLYEIENKENKWKYDYGYKVLNEKLNCLDTPSIITIFSPIAKGKTTFALNMVFSLAQYDNNILYLTNRENGATISKKLLAIASGLNIRNICNNNFSDDEKSLFKETKEILSGFNVYIKEIKKEHDIESTVKEFIDLKINDEQKFIVYDEYVDDEGVLEVLSKISKSFNINVIIIARNNTCTYTTYETLLASLDKKLEQISDCIIGIHRKDYFSFNAIDEVLIHIFRVQNSTPISMKYNFCISNFIYEEKEEMDLATLISFEDLPF